MLREKRQHYCARKRRASWVRARARYVATAKGRANAIFQRDRRIFIGQEYHSRAATVALAQAINHHVRRRRVAFTGQ